MTASRDPGSTGRPPASSPAVRRFMSHLATSGTAPEMSLRSELHRRGLRYRVNVRNLPGSPDIVLSRARIAVFVDGCFWHGCPDHAVPPKANAEWWREKIDKNIGRDARDTARLTELGWLVIRVWEHQAPSDAADEVVASWQERTQHQ